MNSVIDVYPKLRKNLSIYSNITPNHSRRQSPEKASWQCPKLILYNQAIDSQIVNNPYTSGKKFHRRVINIKSPKGRKTNSLGQLKQEKQAIESIPIKQSFEDEKDNINLSPSPRLQVNISYRMSRSPYRMKNHGKKSYRRKSFIDQMSISGNKLKQFPQQLKNPNLIDYLSKQTQYRYKNFIKKQQKKIDIKFLSKYQLQQQYDDNNPITGWN